MSSTENDEVYPILIALMVVAVAIYFGGVYFHVKIIQASRKDKDLTWKLDIANSIILLFNFFQSIFMHTITFIVKDLFLYTGEWFCYLFKIIANYTTFYMYGHAFIISLTKYTIIVHWQAARGWGNEKVAMLYFWINITHPAISILIWLCIRPDFFWAWDGMANYADEMSTQPRQYSQRGRLSCSPASLGKYGFVLLWGRFSPPL